ncbi:tRNA (adenosine(37)-N6)-threonylcarbamoyltransferase complex ATPase subunit type 1 TsaE [Salinactinospora qingdaonensis]|uniref:tRNA threonylcarbamoyladenosine biosynthesis protein TsaE n=1 Tax=Salinactinospora qingdaonensis TaxID=702744 RepID=A0ABP7GGP7_9ACTN
MTDTTETTPPETTAVATATLVAATDADTRDIGRRIGARLCAGDLLILSGPLGAGKTTLTQGLAEGLGVRGPITSPTFVISRIHPALEGGPDLVHADAYRLGSAAEVDDLDLDATVPSAVTVVEWGEGVAEELNDDRLWIVLDRRPDDSRTIRLVGFGDRWSELPIDAGQPE